MESTVDPKDIVLVRVNYDAYTEEERMPEMQFELDYEILEETEAELFA